MQTVLCEIACIEIVQQAIEHCELERTKVDRIHQHDAQARDDEASDHVQDARAPEATQDAKQRRARRQMRKQPSTRPIVRFGSIVADEIHRHLVQQQQSDWQKEEHEREACKDAQACNAANDRVAHR
jgi:hypothetical protein